MTTPASPVPTTPVTPLGTTPPSSDGERLPPSGPGPCHGAAREVARLPLEAAANSLRLEKPEPVVSSWRPGLGSRGSGLTFGGLSPPLASRSPLLWVLWPGDPSPSAPGRQASPAKTFCLWLSLIASVFPCCLGSSPAQRAPGSKSQVGSRSYCPWPCSDRLHKWLLNPSPGGSREGTFVPA